jgi:TRAP-type C4-dicarboxylate transport system permease small subunit
MPSSLDRFLERISSATVVLSGLVIVLMMVMITGDAIGRKLGYPVPGGLELSEAFMVACVYLALMSVQRNRENVLVSIASSGLSPRRQALLDAATAVAALALFLVFTWVAVGKAWDATLQREFRIAAIMVPIWPFRWLIPIGLALLCVQLAATAVEEWRRAWGPSGPQPGAGPEGERR